MWFSYLFADAGLALCFVSPSLLFQALCMPGQCLSPATPQPCELSLLSSLTSAALTGSVARLMDPYRHDFQSQNQLWPTPLSPVLGSMESSTKSCQASPHKSFLFVILRNGCCSLDCLQTLALNSWSFCLCLPSAEIIGVCYYNQLSNLIFCFYFGLFFCLFWCFWGRIFLCNPSTVTRLRSNSGIPLPLTSRCWD